MKSDTCTGCRYRKDCGITQIRRSTGYWQDNNVQENALDFRPARTWIAGPDELGPQVQTFRCMCPHPSSCYDTETDVERIYMNLDGTVEVYIAQKGCEHYIPTDDLLWESEKSAEAWVEKVFSTNDRQNAARIISEKINSLIVQPDLTQVETGV